MKRALTAAVFLVSVACQARIPDVDPTKLACFDDVPIGGGELPCPASHRCEDNSCTPRLDCRVPQASRPGCDPEQRCGEPGFACQRCEPIFTAELAAVHCEGGIHTATSAPPLEGDACACPADSGLHCVVFADRAVTAAADPYPLFLLPPGTPLPTGKLGITGEIRDRRSCARACSSELDCPGGHTCRAAAVVTTELLADPTSARSTIGVCYPDLVTTTSTSSQPDPKACREHRDCEADTGIEPCRYSVVPIPDHPTAPAGEAWGAPDAIVLQCGTALNSNLQRADQGCTNSNDCKSSLCVLGNCAIPCNPIHPDVCPSNRPCADVLVRRELPGGGVVEDRATLCAER